ncbi:hypothetical protein HG536_0F01650 [Torulaspora globosa]|uniref:Vacuolar protein sorting-associated protein 51 homolog n=1 Tax=Torulaspora globosa TaxID=48254 RepID=A0A7G3ZK04_9SACH|nr:uncharacterized protein HG536_0F01650 [Torulaspora globosa]QLL33840.1 hypothetical protein HG536_0F01650 [Torulaspora globosa]
MTQQISHKKSLRFSRLNRDRRQLLKEYYKLEQPGSAEGKEQPQEEQRPTVNAEAAQEHVEDAAADDRPIAECDFAELVRLHNKLLKKEAEMNNSIKSTIYENYYDLVKVNELLKEISSANEPLLDRLKETIELLRG